MISNNPSNIKKVQKKDLVVTTSVESAELLIRKHKYNTLIYDTEDISPILAEAGRKNIKVMSFPEYISTGDTVSKITNTLKKTLISRSKSKKVYRQAVISVWSAKGGVGRTTLVKALSEALPKDLRILILDLNLRDGGSDLSYMLRLPVLPHMGMYLRQRDRESFERNLVEFRNNIYIMQVPPKLNLVSDINADDIRQMIDYGRTLFDFVIIDLPNEDNEFVRTALEYSNRVLVLTSATEAEIKRIAESCSSYDYSLVVVNPVSRMWRTLIGVLNAPVLEVKDLDAEAEDILAEVV